MKKFLSLLCMITCVFGLTACGNNENYTAYEQEKMEKAKTLAVEKIVPGFEEFIADEALLAAYDEYTAEEIAHDVETKWGIEANGYAVMTAIDSFDSATEAIGAITNIGEASARINDKQLIVTVKVQGENQNAEAEVIFSNDMFLTFESAALNPEETMSDLMTKAALNTLIGMGTVFVVLILISGIISCFRVIPKIQAAFSKKDEKAETKKVETKKAETKTTGVDNAVAQITAQEESVVLTDDLELVAVIAAAIAASNGATSTDGFVVRSIRKVRRSR